MIHILNTKISRRLWTKITGVTILFFCIFLITPAVTHAATYQGSPGFPVTVSGTKFTREGNAVQLTNPTTQEYFEVLDLKSDDTKTLTFIVPTSTSPGSYTIKVGAFNSPWSNSLPFTVTGIKAPKLTFTSNPEAAMRVGQSATLNWRSEGAPTCVSTSTEQGLPEAWTTPDYEGTFVYTPTTAGDPRFTLTCTGPGGTVTKTVSFTVIVIGQTYPVVSINSVNSGQGSTVTWSVTNAASCKKNGSGDQGSIAAWTATSTLTGSMYLTPSATTTLVMTCSSGGRPTLTRQASTILPVISVAPQGTLSVTCSATPSYGSGVAYNELVTFTATPKGGTGTYTYAWSGSDGLQGSTPVVSKYYPSTVAVGTKAASVKVTSGPWTAAGSCGGVFINKYKTVPVATGALSSELTLGPTFGHAGTEVTIRQPYQQYSGALVDSRFGPATTVVVERNGIVVAYMRPSFIRNSTNSSSPNDHYVQFKMALSPAAPLGVYSLYLQNWNGTAFVQSNKMSFNYGGTTAPVDTTPVPTITSMTPTSGPLNSSVIVLGNNFTLSSVIILKHAGVTKTVSPSYTPPEYLGTPAKLVFNFNAGLPIGSAGGDYQIIVSTGSKSSVPIIFTVASTPPTVVLEVSPESVVLGNSATVSWTVSNTDPSLCTGTGFSYPRTSSGSVPIYPAQTSTVSLTCVSPGGSVVKSATVAVTEPRVAKPQTPETTLYLAFSASPTSLTEGQSTTLYWETENASSCTLTNTGAATWTGSSGSVSASGGTTSGTLSESTTFTLICNNLSGTGSLSRSVTVNVTPTSPAPLYPVPLVTVSASPTKVTSSEQSVTVTWSSLDATSCTLARTPTVAGDYWAGVVGSINTSGSLSGTISKDTTFTVTCTGQGGTGSKSALVNYLATDEASLWFVRLFANVQSAIDDLFNRWVKPGI